MNELESLYDACDSFFYSLEKGVFMADKDIHPSWLQEAVKRNRLLSVKLILDGLEVPDNMSLKERISYYYLLGD